MSASPYDLVRAEDPVTGQHVTVYRAYAKTHDFKVLDKAEAVDRDGRPLPVKPRTDKAGQPVAKTAETAAAKPSDKKES